MQYILSYPLGELFIPIPVNSPHPTLDIVESTICGTHSRCP